MIQPENTTGTPRAQAKQFTTGIEFGETPVSNRGECLFQTVPGIPVEDALQQARTLSSGLLQLGQGIHQHIAHGGDVYCDGMMAICFLADTINALICSAQNGILAPGSQEAN